MKEILSASLPFNFPKRKKTVLTQPPMVALLEMHL